MLYYPPGFCKLPPKWFFFFFSLPFFIFTEAITVCIASMWLHNRFSWEKYCERFLVTFFYCQVTLSFTALLEILLKCVCLVSRASDPGRDGQAFQMTCHCQREVVKNIVLLWKKPICAKVCKSSCMEKLWGKPCL